jgi:uncharacterized protein (DUF1697 family)
VAEPAIVFLRAINLGARNRVPMAALRELLEALGHREPRTLLQSGNAVFVPARRPGPALAREIEQAIERELGVETRAILRTRRRLRAVVAADPLGEVADDPKRHLVSFMDAEPDARRVKELLTEDFGPERIAIDGREAHLWYPHGVQGAKLSNAYVEKRLGVVATGRNWDTIVKALELAES